MGQDTATLVFIEKARKVHGDTYDYSKVKYIKAKIKVRIGCAKHGEFEQAPDGHLAGAGCPRCGELRTGAKRRAGLSKFIQKAKKKHGDYYDYSLVEYKTCKDKVKIVCPEHGVFEQTPDSHVQGKGCVECGRLKAADSMKWTTEEFIENARKVHGDYYDYSKVDYKRLDVHVTIICPEHGEFEQAPYSHINQKARCPKCAKIASSRKQAKSPEDWIKQATEIHNGKYDYSKTKYFNSLGRVTITCPEHGDFEMIALNHLHGQGCAVCSRNKKGDTSAFIEKARAVHGDRFDYSKVDYINTNTKVIITCPIHGDFEQTPGSHLYQKAGCRKCSNIKLSKEQSRTVEKWIEQARKVHGDKYDYSKVTDPRNIAMVPIICPEHGEFTMLSSNHLQGKGCIKCAGILPLETEEFIRRAKETHGDKYDYSKAVYVTNKEKITIICPKHGEFYQTPSDHYRFGCPNCGHSISRGEKEMLEWVQKYVPEAHHATKILNGKDIDIYLPNHKIGIEYNGLFWHSSQYRDAKAHEEKRKDAERNGIYLMQFWDYEWESKKKIIKSIILNALNMPKKKIYARDTVVKSVQPTEARNFCALNHIHSFRAAAVYKGLYYNDELVALMSASSEGEMVRFVVKNFYSVVGAFSKLLKHLDISFSYVDKRIFTGKGYLSNGFVLEKETLPNYFYSLYGKYAGSRQMFQKHKLPNLLEVFDENLSEEVNMVNNGYYRVYDCGNYKMKKVK